MIEPTTHRPHVIGGCSTYSKTQFAHLSHYPKSLSWVEGVMAYRADGRWIDFTGALGAVFLGYGAVDKAITNHLELSGALLPLPCWIEAAAEIGRAHV